MYRNPIPKSVLALVPERSRLYLRNPVHSEPLERIQTLRMRRQALISQVHDLAELTLRPGCKLAPCVAIVWSGRDCDGVQYAGQVRIVEATIAAVDEHIEHTLNWADGPCGYQLMSPSAAEHVEYSSRDLTLEAFEDGHQHVLYS